MNLRRLMAKEPELFTDTDLAAANQALAKGVKINDSQGDFYQYAPGVTEPF